MAQNLPPRISPALCISQLCTRAVLALASQRLSLSLFTAGSLLQLVVSRLQIEIALKVQVQVYLHVYLNTY